MLVLRTKKSDVVRIGDDILIRIDGASGKNLHLQIEAPRDKRIIHEPAERTKEVDNNNP